MHLLRNTTVQCVIEPSTLYSGTYINQSKDQTMKSNRRLNVTVSGWSPTMGSWTEQVSWTIVVIQPWGTVHLLKG